MQSQLEIGIELNSFLDKNPELYRLFEHYAEQALAFQLDQVNATKEELEVQLATATLQLHAILQSNSWRITAPLRFVKAARCYLIDYIRTRFNQSSWLQRMVFRLLSFGWRFISGRPRRALDALLGVDTVVNGVSQITSTGLTYPAKLKLRLIAGAGGTTTCLSDIHPHKRRILCVSHVMPYPSRAGNEYRIHKMLSWLESEKYEVLLVVCPLPGEVISTECFKKASEIYPRLVVLQRSGDVETNFADAMVWLSELEKKTVRNFSVILNEHSCQYPSESVVKMCQVFCPDTLIEILLALENSYKPSIFLAEYIFMTRSFSLFKEKLVKIIDTHDVLSTNKEKVMQYGIDDVLTISTHDEAALLRRGDIIVGIQSKEVEILKKLVPKHTVINVGIDFSIDGNIEEAPRKQIVLIVASNNAMNKKGLLDFMRFAWPLIRRECPIAKFRIVGDVGKVLKIASKEVEVFGRVDDLHSMYAGADLVINPAVAGTGLKIKTVEALCHLRPIVTFPAGVDGIDLEATRLLKVAHNWYEFASLVIDRLNNPIESVELAKQAEVLASKFSSSKVYAELNQVLNKSC